VNNRTYAGWRSLGYNVLCYTFEDQVIDLAQLAEEKGWVLIADPSWGANKSGNEQTATIILTHALNNPLLAQSLVPFMAEQIVALWGCQWSLHRDALYKWVAKQGRMLEQLRQQEQRNGDCCP